jgi:Tol biopolymer transport system component
MDRRWIVTGVGLIIIVGLVFFLRANLPSLLEVSPANGEAYVAASQPVVLTFSESMQPEDVAQKLEIEPFTPGSYEWDANTLTFTPAQPWPSGAQITVTLQSGARSTMGLPLLRGQSWSFSVSPPLLMYLWPAGNAANLYVIDLDAGNSLQLTDTPNGVLAFDLNADGTAIYYSIRLDGENSAIFRLNRVAGTTDQILYCSNVLCSAPQISPGGEYLAYSRAPSNPEDETFPHQVWLLPIVDGAPAPKSQAQLVSDPTHPAGSPFWSPTGLLTFHDQAAQQFVVFDPQNEARTFFPNETGEPGTWSPDGSNYIVHEVAFWGSGPLDFSSHLWKYAYPSAQATNLSLDLALEDVTPAYSPDGAQIAFGRKYLDPERWTLGSQLWLMRPDGSRARQLTDSPDFNHADFAWHPNGEYLAFVRHKQTTLIDPPEIWIIRADGSDAVRLVIGGHVPQWIP